MTTGAPQKRFGYWLGQTLRHEREKAGMPLGTIASIIDVKHRDLERTENDEKAYYPDIDRTVAAYAYALGLTDSRALWLVAILQWLQDGDAPDFTDEFPGGSFVQPVRAEAQRQWPVDSELTEMLDAMLRWLAAR